jgi:hypothetical protein
MCKQFIANCLSMNIQFKRDPLSPSEFADGLRRASPAKHLRRCHARLFLENGMTGCGE